MLFSSEVRPSANLTGIGVRSGCRGGHKPCPFLPIYRSGERESKNYFKSRVK